MILDSKWAVQTTDADILLMARTLGISQITARVMANRGIRTKNTAIRFMHPNLQSLHPFQDICKGAIERIEAAINNGENITIYGDYDVDGITSTAILHKVITSLGGNSSYYIPHRVTEGYGLNKTAIKNIALQGTTLIIAVDNGISAIEEVAFAKALGVDTIIIDHHEQGDELPAAVAIVDPKQKDCTYPFKELCSGGLCYKFAAQLCAHMGKEFANHDEALALAAFATVCDIVPLLDENRTIVSCGMALLNSNKFVSPGLGSLITLRGYLDKPIDAFTFGFVLGPCINAAGRLQCATQAMELLTATEADTTLRLELANQLLTLNEERKEITEACTKRILNSLPNPLSNVLVVEDRETHESIAGIVAGRVREATGRPTIVLTLGEGCMKGSGRSFPGYNIFEALHQQKHLFSRFGGHAMAAGLSMQEENVPLLREALNKTNTLTPEDFCKIYEIDMEIGLSSINLELAQALERLAPFGSSNREPLFAIYGVYVHEVRVLDEKNTLIFTFLDTDRRRYKGIAFGLNQQYAQSILDADVNKHGGFYMDIAHGVEVNVFGGNSSAQLRIRDFKDIRSGL